MFSFVERLKRQYLSDFAKSSVRLFESMGINIKMFLRKKCFFVPSEAIMKRNTCNLVHSYVKVSLSDIRVRVLDVINIDLVDVKTVINF